MHLLRIGDLRKQQIKEIFYLAEQLSKRASTPVPALKGKCFVLFFPESSIRTRTTFEKGIQDLGGASILFPPDTFDKPEALRDVIGYLKNWANGVVIRYPHFKRVFELAEYSEIPIINAMTSENHPCEILSDYYSIGLMKPSPEKLNYTFVGPANNIARSWMELARVMGFQLNHICIPGNQMGPESTTYHFTPVLEPVLQETDVVLTDSLPVGLRSEEYYSRYQITLARMALTRPGAILNPCPPFFRGQEIAGEAVESDYFVGYGFKKSLIFVQQAILLYCLGYRTDN